jgi:branched-chain amino acid transport system substrate-binding protein
MISRRAWLLVAGVVLVTTIGATSWLGKSKDGKAIEIGAILPLTGNLALLGGNVHDGMLLAQEEINASGGASGRPIAIKFEDSRGEPATAVSSAQKLLNIDGINLIVTHFTGPSAAVKPLIQDRGGLQVIFAMDEALVANTGKGSIFRFYPGIREEGHALLAIAKERAPKRVSVLYFKAAVFDAEVREVLLPGLQRLGITADSFVFDELDSNKLRNLATQMKAAAPDLVFMIGFHNQMPLMLDILTEQKVAEIGNIAGGLNLGIAVDSKGIPPSRSSGLTVGIPLSNVVDSGPIADDFTKRFRTRFGKEPDLDAAYAYATVRLIADAAAGTDGSATAISSRLKEFRERETVVGNLIIKPDGNSASIWVTVKYADGKARRTEVRK